MSVLIHVGVRASDLSKSIRFWRDGLGLRVAGKRGIRYDLTDGYHNFAVFQHQGDDRPEHVSGMVDYLHIGVGVPDLAAAARRLRDMGYTIYSDGLGGKTPSIPTIWSSPPSKSKTPTASPSTSAKSPPCGRAQRSIQTRRRNRRRRSRAFCVVRGRTEVFAQRGNSPAKVYRLNFRLGRGVGPWSRGVNPPTGLRGPETSRSLAGRSTIF